MEIAWNLMKWPLLACLLLPGILVYYGLHIIRREIIFVDLALAQVAALGTCVAVLLGYEVHQLLFGLVVTTFVQIGGVLLTFSYLIIPAVCAGYLVDSLAARLWTAWGIAVAGGLLGAGASYQLDLPTGAAIVCTLGMLLLVAPGAGVLRRRWARDRVPASAAGCPGKGRHRSVASSSAQYWRRITGLPGWKRRQFVLPAFRQARCTPPPRPSVWQRLRTALDITSSRMSAVFHRTTHHARQRSEAASHGPRKASL